VGGSPDADGPAVFYLALYRFGVVTSTRPCARRSPPSRAAEETVRRWTREWFVDEVVRFAAPAGRRPSRGTAGRATRWCCSPRRRPTSRRIATEHFGLDAFLSTRYEVKDGVFTASWCRRVLRRGQDRARRALRRRAGNRPGAELLLRGLHHRSAHPAEGGHPRVSTRPTAAAGGEEKGMGDIIVERTGVTPVLAGCGPATAQARLAPERSLDGLQRRLCGAALEMHQLFSSQVCLVTRSRQMLNERESLMKNAVMIVICLQFLLMLASAAGAGRVRHRRGLPEYKVCNHGTCETDICIDVPCTSRPPTCAPTARPWRTSSPRHLRGRDLHLRVRADPCAQGCLDGQCIGDPCAGVDCTNPRRTSAPTRRTDPLLLPGTCAGGSCSYESS